MIRFCYIPAVVRKEKTTTHTWAHFGLVLKDNGCRIDLPTFKYEDETMSCDIAKCYGDSTSAYLVEGRLRIVISTNRHEAIQARAESSSDELERLKDRIPVLVKAVKEAAEKSMPNWVDLDGNSVRHEITAEYYFQGKTSIEKEVDVVEERAKVQFDCRSDAKTIFEGRCKAGKILYPYGVVSTPNSWSISRLGEIVVPDVIKWTPEEIEEAFRDLANQLIAQPEAPQTQIWKTKEVVKISLE